MYVQCTLHSGVAVHTRPVLLALTSQMGVVIRDDLCSRYFRFVNRKGFVASK